MKPRLTLRIDTKLNAQLCQAARERRTTKTAIVEAALRNHFDPEACELLEERLIRRLDRYEIHLGYLERDIAITMEMLANYLVYWLARFEPFPEGEKNIANGLARRRFDHFIKQVAAKVTNGESTAATALRAQNIRYDFDDDIDY